MALEKVPKGFVRAKIGTYTMEKADTLASNIKERIRKEHRPIGVAMDKSGNVYAMKHLSDGFQRVLRYEQHLVVGVYNFDSTSPNIADDIRAHAKEIGL